MVPISCLVLRGGLAVAVAVLASPRFPGTIAVAQQIAVNVEGQAAQRGFPGRGATGRRSACSGGRSCLSIRARRLLERSSSIRVNAISTLVQPNDRAIRYGIGVGRIGFQWSGVERGVPETRVAGLARPTGNGRTAALSASVFMAGGVRAIPVGARALYLGHSVFRIHGTNQPETIGHAVSSGCFRLDNADVIDLYDRVQVGAKVLVRQAAHVS